MNIELFGQYWHGDHAVGEDESSIIVLRQMLVDGRVLHYSKATIEWEASPSFPGDFLTIRLEGVPGDESVRFGSNQVLQGTDENTLWLPISKLSFHEAIEA